MDLKAYIRNEKEAIKAKYFDKNGEWYVLGNIVLKNKTLATKFVGMGIPFRTPSNMEVMRAFRDTVSDQINSYRQDVFKDSLATIVCPVSGLSLFDDAETHIDHNYDVLPFKDLVDNFFTEHKINPYELDVESLGITRRVDDHQVTKAFKEYHKQHAQLRAIHKSANSKGKKFTTT